MGRSCKFHNTFLPIYIFRINTFLRRNFRDNTVPEMSPPPQYRTRAFDKVLKRSTILHL